MPDFESSLTETTVALICDRDRRTEMAAIGRNLVDGRGAERIVDTLIEQQL